MNRLERPCNQCGTNLYWNAEDTTLKSTGSWYEDYTDSIHDQELCSLRKQERDF